jgi:hypothetical protein
VIGKLDEAWSILLRLRRQFERRLVLKLAERLQHQFISIVRRSRQNEALEIRIAGPLQVREALSRIVDRICTRRTFVLGLGEVGRLREIRRHVVDLRPIAAVGPGTRRDSEKRQRHDGAAKNPRRCPMPFVTMFSAIRVSIVDDEPNLLPPGP